MLHQLPVVPGVRLHAMQTDKFKTACFSVNFLRPHSARDAALDALLPSVLLRGTERYPDIRSISMRLDDLYGATFGRPAFTPILLRMVFSRRGKVCSRPCWSS